MSHRDNATAVAGWTFVLLLVAVLAIVGVTAWWLLTEVTNVLASVDASIAAVMP